jgi:hypothetical protein
MRVMVVHHTPSLTMERYEAVVRGLTGGKPRLDSISDVPTDGLLVHVAAETEEGFTIFDVFESQEAFDRFRAITSPIATEAGIEEPPKSYPRYTRTSPPDGQRAQTHRARRANGRCVVVPNPAQASDAAPRRRGRRPLPGGRSSAAAPTPHADAQCRDAWKATAWEISPVSRRRGTAAGNAPVLERPATGA